MTTPVTAAPSDAAGTRPQPPRALPVDVPGRFPAGSIARPEQAEEALSEVALQRAWLDARYVNEQRACYDKFFTSRCLDKARESHRLASNALRPVEVEANAFLRRYKVEQRDLALAQQREKDQADQQRRDAARKDREARLAKSAAERNQAAAQPARPKDDRVARHEERLRQQRAEDAANAPKRAENAAAFERKKRESEQRQREIAEKKAAKEKEQAGKAGAGNGNAGASAPPAASQASSPGNPTATPPANSSAK